jgi:ubiquinone/menaquinone biosynthesis C-methylase UbiE
LRSEDNAGLVEWYDILAGAYDELYAQEQVVKYAAALESIGDRRFDVIVDVACGTGLFLDRLTILCELVVGVDLSRGMLEKARRSAGGNVSLVRADCARLPLKDEMADCIFAISLLKAGRELEGQVSEMARVVRRQGLVVGTVFRDGKETSPSKLGFDNSVELKDLSSRESLFLVRRAML